MQVTLPSQDIKNLILHNIITADVPIEASQIQPASLDLRLSNICYEINGQFLPNTISLETYLKDCLFNTIDDNKGIRLYVGKTYLFPLMEKIKIATLYNNTNFNINIYGNPKSTTGRLGISTRLLGNKSYFYDGLRYYDGNLYLYVTPLAFDIIVRPGDCLHQIRFEEILINPYPSDLPSSDVIINISPNKLCAYESRKNYNPIDIRKINHYKISSYWTTVEPNNKYIFLAKNKIYFARSKNKVTVSSNMCAELVQSQYSIEEFHVLHKGFFDPGFNAYATFEIIPHHDVYLSHDQQVATINFMKMSKAPDEIYGTNIGSSYQGQELALSKQFRKDEQ